MKKIVLLFWTLALLFSTNLFAQKDVDGAKDSPYISRFEGSHIVWQQTRNFDRYYILEVKDHKITNYEIDGKILRTQYQSTDDHSVFEVASSYKQALQDAGFDVFTQLDEKNCSVNLGEALYNGEFSGLNALPREAIKMDNRNYFSYFAAKKHIQGKDVYVVGYVVGDEVPLIMLDVIEAKSLQGGLVTVDDLTTKMSKKGHLALSGIYFETGKADITAKSAAALKNIADYLNAHKDKKFFIVGHTDNEGDFESNMALSESRAKAVMNELVTNYGVDASQLKAYGVANLICHLLLRILLRKGDL